MQTLSLEVESIQANADAREERRKEPRYAPVLDRAYLGWWERETFRTELGRLDNISTGGAALQLDGWPAVGETVWLSVVGPNATDWVPARLLGCHGQTVRMMFAEPMPYDLFREVVLGFPVARATLRHGESVARGR
jgi:hypothetical protein